MRQKYKGCWIGTFFINNKVAVYIELLNSPKVVHLQTCKSVTRGIAIAKDWIDSNL